MKVDDLQLLKIVFDLNVIYNTKITLQHKWTI